MNVRAWTWAMALAAAAVVGGTGCEPCEEDVCFALPVDNSDGETIGHRVIFHVDHDPEPADDLLGQLKCFNYAGQKFPQCYGDHDGTDFMLVGGFERMDAGSADILAAADGVVIATEDGNYDRCHASLRALPTGGIDCDGHPMRSNFVKVRHADGIVTAYHHMKSGSVAVEVGDPVACGDVLGQVGSSGRSSAPHLHFEVRGPDGELLDPYAGPESQPGSRWVQQGPDGALPAPTCQ